MKAGRKILLAISILIVTGILFLTGYFLIYSMDEADTFEVNSPELNKRVLIATQGSKFKDAVVREIVSGLKSKPIYIKVIDVTSLPTINESDWSAIVIIHTWENWKPQIDSKRFIENTHVRNKLVILSTSGSGDYKMKDVDAISSASIVIQAPDVANEMLMRIEKIIQDNN